MVIDEADGDGDVHFEAVEVVEELAGGAGDGACGGLLELVHGAEDRAGDGGHHGGGDAFAHDVCDDEEEAHVVPWDDVVEVAADGEGAFAVAFGADACDWGLGAGFEGFLDGGGEFEFALRGVGEE